MVKANIRMDMRSRITSSQIQAPRPHPRATMHPRNLATSPRRQRTHWDRCRARIQGTATSFRRRGLRAAGRLGCRPSPFEAAPPQSGYDLECARLGLGEVKTRAILVGDPSDPSNGRCRYGDDDSRCGWTGTGALSRSLVRSFDFGRRAVSPASSRSSQSAAPVARSSLQNRGRPSSAPRRNIAGA